MKSLFIIILAIFTFSSSYGQNLIAVQNGGTPSFYTNLDSAITFANSGDTLYLPGVIFTGNITIEKQIHIIGVGHNPDSSKAYPSFSRIMGNISLLGNSSGSSFTGLYTNNIYIGSNGQAVSSVTLDRCNLGSVYISPDSLSSNHTIITCNINGIIDGGYSTNSFISNCIIDNHCREIGNGSTIQNSIFLESPIQVQKFYKTFNSVIKNNVFVHPYSFASGFSTEFSGNIVRNNLKWNSLSWVNISGSSNNTLIENNSVTGSFIDSVFLDVSSSNSFSYANKYQIIHQLGQNTGDDGTDLGIYGGPFPWKDGSIPFNPHVQHKAIAPVTDSLGRLPVLIRVKAQDY
ncbi:MAG: hypothetical protein AAFY71_27870 [Bacteroidota bacterium]